MIPIYRWLIVLLLMQMTVEPVIAASASPSASSTATASASISLQSKLKSLQEEIASRAAKLKQEINRKLQNRAYVGFIKSKSSTSLTLATISGSRVVNLNDFTQYAGEGKLTAYKNLKDDDYVAALGDVDDTEVLTAKQLVRLPQPSEAKRQIVGGLVTTVGETTLNLRSFTGQGGSFKLNSQTSYHFGKQTAGIEAIKVSKPVLVVEIGGKARLVYIIPYTVTLPKPKTATPSATASPSAKPK